MVVWSTVETSCPICKRRLRVREVGSGFVHSQDSDLLTGMNGKHIIQAEIHTCNWCGYSGYSTDFIAVKIAAKDKKLHKQERLKHTPLPDEQYWRAYTCSLLLHDRSPIEHGMLLVKAYWCCRLAPTRDLSPNELKKRELTYLRGAIAQLRKGMRKNKDPDMLYLVGELCRRAKNFANAKFYLNKFMEEKEQKDSYLYAAATELLKRVEKKDSTPLTMEEVVYEGKKRQ